DPRWAEALLLELRLQGVAGARIGAVLAEVDAHVVDSGETAQEAFGDAVAYARSLDLPEDPAQSSSSIGRTVAASAVQTVGMLGTLWSLRSALDGTPLVLPAGMLLVLVAALAGFVGLWRAGDRVLRAALAPPVLTGVANRVVTAALVAVAVTLREPVATLPAVPVLAGAALALVVGTVWNLREQGTGDPVVDPLDDVPEQRTDRTARWGALLLPVVTVVLGTITALVRRPHPRPPNLRLWRVRTAGRATTACSAWGYFLAAVFFAAGLRAVVRFFAGPWARFSASSSIACSGVIDSGVTSRGSVRFVSPSV